MSKFFQRSLSFGLSLVLTLAMLGSIDQLSQPDEAAPQMAQGSSARA